MALVTWTNWSLQQALENVSKHELRLQRLIGSIIHLDEVLTMSARMAVATGDVRWEDRYRRYEPMLDSAIAESFEIAPKAHAAAAEKTDMANRELVAMENHAFELVRGGLSEEASSLLFSKRYETLKATYAEGMEIMTAGIREHIREALAKSRVQVFQAAGLALASGALLLLAWGGIVSQIRAHLSERERNEEERRRLAAQVGRAQKLESLGILAAGVAHEINNPLAYLRSNVTHLRRLAAIVEESLNVFEPKQAKDLAELPELLEEMLDGLDRIGEIVESTRRFSRDPETRHVPLDMNRVAEDAVRLASFHKNDCVRLETHLGRLPPVEGSAERLVQVLLNLLINAKQVLSDRPAGSILLETVAVDGCAQIRVHDDGPGVPEELRDHLFDPFFTTKGPDEGVGLGLSIAYDIVREHGGTIEIEVSPLGGACFTINLPVAPA
ncbi:MAG: hypothetical protein GY723_16085 [bacterium]|nr:hypothetical protein [bacterium]MCP5068519.1 hypothetical protein [bacterium]